MDYSDAIILASEEVSSELVDYVNQLDKPVLPFVSFQETDEAYANFYNTQVLK